MKTMEELKDACPVSITLGVLDSKWKVFIINVIRDKPMRFGEIQKTISGLSKKVLSESLKSLEEDGIVKRTVFPETPVRIEYSLTELGQTMAPVLDSMRDWGNFYRDTRK